MPASMGRGGDYCMWSVLNSLPIIDSYFTMQIQNHLFGFQSMLDCVLLKFLL